MQNETKHTVTVDLRTAELIRRVFVPTNPNKMRNAHPDVVKAAKDFIAAVELAVRGGGR